MPLTVVTSARVVTEFGFGYEIGEAAAETVCDVPPATTVTLVWQASGYVVRVLAGDKLLGQFELFTVYRTITTPEPPAPPRVSSGSVPPPPPPKPAEPEVAFAFVVAGVTV
jgi:hypothetical protein